MRIILPDDRPLSVFVDTSVIIAGVVSQEGASGAVLDLCEAEIMTMVISRQVLTEADRNFEKKFPHLIQEFREFIRNINPLLAPDPTAREIAQAKKLTNAKDAPILACAIRERVDFLVTLDKKFRVRGTKSPLAILSPSEFLRKFRAGRDSGAAGEKTRIPEGLR